jgi:TRAP-type C4-dicarboxylate transport system permease small subunit
MRSWLHRLPRLVLAALMIIAVINLLIGVFLRYIMVEVCDYFDWPIINYVWVEEVGELALAWMALIGAAVGIRERAHFTLEFLTHRFPPRAQVLISRFNAMLIAVFGLVAAWFGWKLCVINSELESPGLSLNLAWLYGSAVVGGTLIALYGFALAITGPPPETGAEA